MLTKLALTLFGCLASIGCTFHSESKQSLELTDIEPNKNVQVTGNSWAKNQQQLANSKLLPATNSDIESSKPWYTGLPSAKQGKPDERVSKKSEPKNYDSKPQLAVAVKTGSYITLTSRGEKNALGNPLYQLSLYANGRLIGAYATVSGRAHTQNRNRNRAGTEAPLPDGKYKVDRTPIPGSISEAGDLFLPIQPLFRTGRSALGIHYDPSFGKRNGEDGTSGCVALTSKRELNEVLNYVRTYQPKYFEVNIQ